MRQKLLAVLLILMMTVNLFSSTTAYADSADVILTITPSQEEAHPGDEITYTVTMSEVTELLSVQMVLQLPEGLEYVADSGELASGVKEAMGFDLLDWTEVSKMVNGSASATPYTSSEDTVLFQFKCKVADNATGNLAVSLQDLEFYDSSFKELECEVVLGEVAVESEPAETPDVEAETVILTITPSQETAHPGDEITYTVSMGTVTELLSMQMVLQLPEGLEYVADSGELVSGVKEAMGFDLLDWTEVSKMVNGSASATPYTSIEDIVLFQFKCKVAEDATGNLAVSLQELEFYNSAFIEFDYEVVQGEIVVVAAHTGGTATCHTKAVCTVCHTEYGEYDATNHDGEVEVRNAVLATEEAGGYTGDTYCLGCGQMIAEGNATEPLAHTHAMELVAAVAPTHEESGNIAYYTCTKCGNLFADEAGEQVITLADTILSAEGHTYQYQCDENNHWEACDCGSQTEASAHTYGEWTEVQAPTADQYGIKERTCTVCGYQETAEIAPSLEEEDGSSTGDNALLLWELLLAISGIGAISMFGSMKKKKQVK